MGLFDVVYHGSDEMYEKARIAVRETIEKLGEDAPVAFGGTAYHLACIKAYTGNGNISCLSIHGCFCKTVIRLCKV